MVNCVLCAWFKLQGLVAVKYKKNNNKTVCVVVLHLIPSWLSTQHHSPGDTYGSHDVQVS